MLIFTDEFIREMRQRYDGLKSESCPRLYHIATKEKGAPLREKLERWAAAVPNEVLQAMLPRLRNPAQHGHTANELLTAYHLSEIKHELTYEPLLGAQTPDFIASRKDCGRFIVEVLTCDLSDKQKAQAALQADLIRRIQALPFNVVLTVGLFKRHEDLTHKINKITVEALRMWLGSAPPKVGASCEIEGIMFSVCRLRPDSKTVLVGFFSPGMSGVDEDRLREKIRGKVKKYKDSINEHNIPFVVAAVPDFAVGLDYESIVRATTGTEGITACVDTTTGQMVGGSHTFKANDGLFCGEEAPLLSAVVWIEENDGHSDMKVLQNPHAGHPLPSHAFPA